MKSRKNGQAKKFSISQGCAVCCRISLRAYLRTLNLLPAITILRANISRGICVDASKSIGPYYESFYIGLPVAIPIARGGGARSKHRAIGALRCSVSSIYRNPGTGRISVGTIIDIHTGCGTAHTGGKSILKNI